MNQTMPMNRSPKPNPFVESSSGLTESSTDYSDDDVMFVEEIEDDGAWVMPGNGQGDRQYVPLSSLPKGVKVGDHFTSDGRIMPQRRFDSSGLYSNDPGGTIRL
jgi:hypothetical protein